MEQQAQQTSAGQGNAIFSYVLSFVAIVLSFIFKGWGSIIPAVLAIVIAIVSIRDANKGFGPRPLTRMALITAIIALLASSYNYYTKMQKRGNANVEMTAEEKSVKKETKEKKVEEAVKETSADKEKEQAEEEMQGLEKSDTLSDEEKAEKLNQAASSALEELNEELEE